MCLRQIISMAAASSSIQKIIIAVGAILILPLFLMGADISDSQIGDDFSFVDGNFDGIDDRREDSLFSNAENVSRDITPQAGFGFVRIWESEQSPMAVWCAAVADLDNDGLPDIIYPTYQDPYTVIHVYKNNGDNSFEKVWASDSLHYGVAKALAVDDLDNDGLKDIAVAHYSDKIRIFKNEGNNDFTELPYINVEYDDLRFDDMTIADTDNDGQKEILILKHGYFAIFENGEKIFEWGSNKDYQEIHVGYLDDDEYPEIVVIHPVWNPRLKWIEVFEFNTSSGTYGFRSIDVPASGTRTGAIADVDMDGQNEVILAGCTVDGIQQLRIYRATSQLDFELVDMVRFPEGISTLTNISVKDIMGSEYPEIAVTSHAVADIGRLFIFSKESGQTELIYASDGDLEESLAHLYTVDMTYADSDSLPDIVLGCAVNRAVVLEYNDVSLCGDANGNFTIGLVDIAILIDYLYNLGPAPADPENVDVNASGTIDLLDIVYLIRYLFFYGPIPVCP